MANAQDEVPDKRTPLEIAKYYQEQLALADKDRKDFVDDGKKVSKRFKSGKDALRSRTKRLNILYSNTEVLRAALYGKSAVPDVRRRFGMEDKAAGMVATVLEKSLVYCAEAYDSDKQIELGILDYLLPGRGVVRIEYEPTISNDPSTGQQHVTNQKVQEKYVHWMDFRHMPARTWDDILKHGWVSFAHRMTRQELVANFGDVGNRAPLNWMPDIVDKKDAPESLKKAEVFEIWDINDRKRYWIIEGFEEPCRIDPDPYGLEQFFPLPEPPAYYTTTDSIIPEPEFHIYQDQADDLDEIIARISRLTKALKRRGVYDQSIKELSRLANAADNQFIAVQNYQALATKGGLAAAFQTEDISILATVLIQLYQQKDMLIQAIWELVGIADIMRGQTQASETLGAQQLKAQFGSQRLKRRQRTIQKWVASLLKLKAEILAEHFEPEVLEQMTGEDVAPKPQPTMPPMPQLPPGADPQAMQAMQQQVTQQYQQQVQAWQKNEADKQQVMQILRTDKLRAYRVDVETDSTVFEDAEAEKATRSALIGAVSQFITAWGPIVAESPPLAPVAFELLKFGLGAFKSTRAIEDAIEQAAGALEQKAAIEAQQGPKPTPEEKKIAAESKQAQDQHNLDVAKAQNDAKLKEREMASKEAHERNMMALETEKHRQEMAMRREEMHMKAREADHKMQMEQRNAKHTEDMAKKDHALKTQDFISKEHERKVQKGERDKQHQLAERQATREDFQTMSASNDSDRNHEMAEKQHGLTEKKTKHDMDTADETSEAGNTVAEATKALPKVADAISKSVDKLEEISEKMTKPRKRTAHRDEAGNITHTVEESV